MNIDVVQGNIAQYEADCVVVNLFEGVDVPGGGTGALDKALGGAIEKVIANGDFSGEAGTTTLLYTDGKIPAPRVLVVGLGEREKFDLHAVRKASAVAAKELNALKGVKTFATIVHGAGIAGLETQEAAQAVAEGSLLAVYQAPQYRRKMNTDGVEHCAVVEFNAKKLGDVQDGVSAGVALTKGVCSARDYVSEPANILSPVELAHRARQMARPLGLHCTILGETEMRDLNMGILLSVTQGSSNEAQMIILEHLPPGTEDDAPIVLVGKGVTFDTGGISLKPPGDMWEMKYDMGGAGTVIGAMEAIGRLNLQRRVIGVAACVENMPDGNAFRPGDIFTGITGKTTEIISTDAEGRLILADTLGYVERYKPQVVVDLATLTGACVIALGPQAAGLFSNDEAVQEALVASGKRSGDRLWPLPLFDEYKEDIKSDMAEVKNSGGRFGGVATSAKFLEHFTEGYPWAHLDIAGMVWDKSGKNPMSPKGATGYGVRLLVDFVQTFA